MYYQNSKKINPFARFGCYFISLGKIAELATERPISPADVWETYVLACSSGWMKVDCYVLQPAKILQRFLDLLDPDGAWAAEYTGWWNQDTGTKEWGGHQYNYVVERHTYPHTHHFRLNDWDPNKGDMDGVAVLTGKRFFHVHKAG